MNPRFPILSIISIILRVSGWLVVIGGLYFVVVEGIIEPNQAGHHFSGEDMMDIIKGVSFIISGLLCAAFGEIIGVLFAIEQNTRNHNIEILNTVEDKTTEWSCPKCSSLNPNVSFTCKNCGYCLK